MAKKHAKKTKSKKDTGSKANVLKSKKGVKNKKIIKSSGKKTIKKVGLNPNKGLGLYVRIKSLLWNRFKQDYRGIDYKNKESQFLFVVHGVYEQCKTLEGNCSDDFLISKYKEVLRRPQPHLPPDLYTNKGGEVHRYWDIKDIEFELFEPYLYVTSPMISSPPSGFFISDYVSSTGDKSDGYQSFFKQWIDWCNNEFSGVGSEYYIPYDYIPYFVFTPPEWNEESSRWETEVLITDLNDVIKDFGYTPLGGTKFVSTPKETPTSPILPTDVTEEYTEVPAPKQEIVEQKETESQRKLNESQRLVNESQILANESQILANKSQVLLNKRLGYIEEIKMWKEIGEKEKMKNAILKLEITIKQIEAL